MAKRASASAAAGAAPSLDAKSLPSRPRGKNTYEVVLATAGEVLAEVGFERLTTNLVCERAGLTPPALYRYFPNKYALVSELARRLMEAQDEAVFQWLDEGGAISSSLEEAVEKNLRLQKRQIEITRGQPGGAGWREYLVVSPAADGTTRIDDVLFATRRSDTLRARLAAYAGAR